MIFYPFPTIEQFFTFLFYSCHLDASLHVSGHWLTVKPVFVYLKVMANAHLLVISLAFSQLCRMGYLLVCDPLPLLSTRFQVPVVSKLVTCIMLQYFSKSFLGRKVKELMYKSCLDILVCLLLLPCGGLVSACVNYQLILFFYLN